MQGTEQAKPMCRGPLKRVVGADQLGGELRHWNIESRLPGGEGEYVGINAFEVMIFDYFSISSQHLRRPLSTSVSSFKKKK